MSTAQHPNFVVGSTASKRRRINMSTNDSSNNNSNNNGDTDTTAMETDDIGPLFLNRWVDCQDYLHKWYEAQIVLIDENNPNRYKVHYKGWKEKFDEWIDVSKEPERVRVLHTFTPKGTVYGGSDIINNLRKGMKYDVLDSQDKWYEAQVIEQDLTHNYVKFHYTQWSSTFDEWINADSYRIAPLHTKTSPITNDSNKKNNNSTINSRGSNSATSNRNGSNNTSSSNRSQTNPSNRNSGNISSNNSSNRGNTRRRDSGGGHAQGNIVKKLKKPNMRGNNSNNNSTMLNMTGRPVSILSVPVQSVPSTTTTTNGTSTTTGTDTTDENDQKNEYLKKKQEWDSLTEEEKQKKTEHAKIRVQYMLNFKPTKRDEENFYRVIERRGLRIVNMGEDGNCLFRSISHQIYGTEEYHAILRSKCVEYLRAESNYYKDFIPGGSDAFNRYCTRMSRNGVWGDNLEIQAFFEIYQRPIEIYAYSDKPMKTFSNDPQNTNNSNNNIINSSNNNVSATNTNNSQNLTQSTSNTASSAASPREQPIRLSYHFNSHYNSIIDPQNHANTVEKSKPGEIEDTRIKLSSLRTQSAYGQSIAVSDVTATELAYLNAALTASRKYFESNGLHYDQKIMDSAAKESLKSLDSQFEMQMKEAITSSLQEKEKEDIQKELEMIEQADIEKAMQRSMNNNINQTNGVNVNNNNNNIINNNNATLGGDITDAGIDDALLIGLIESQNNAIGSNVNNNNNNQNNNSSNDNNNNNNNNNINGSNNSNISNGAKEDANQLFMAQEKLLMAQQKQQQAAALQYPAAVKMAMDKGCTYDDAIVAYTQFASLPNMTDSQIADAIVNVVKGKELGYI